MGFQDAVEIARFDDPAAICMPQRHSCVLKEESGSIVTNAMRQELVQVLGYLNLIVGELWFVGIDLLRFVRMCRLLRLLRLLEQVNDKFVYE